MLHRFAGLMRTFVAALALTLLCAAPGRAQLTANGTMTVAIQQALVVTKTGDMDLGTVSAGTSKSISATSGSALAFSVTGPASGAFQATFTFPTQLDPIGGATGGAIPLMPASWTGAWATTSAFSGSTAFTPVTGTPVPLALTALGQLYLRVGGSVAGSNTAGRLGSFSGTITVTVL